VRMRLQPVSETASLDAQLLLAHVLGVTRAWVLAHPEVIFNPDQRADLEAGLRRLEAGEPLPYLLGHWEFYGLDFTVSPAVLIPRPETELLVDEALHWISLRPKGQPCRVIDVGCGSGCMAIALAVNAAGLSVNASDISPDAVDIARQNVIRHELTGRVHVSQADLLPQDLPWFDLICANLPYIPSDKLAGLPVARWEPPLALDGGPDGLALIRRLLRQAPARLAPRGLLLLEIESSQGPAACLLAQEAFPHARVELYQDLAGLDRLVRVELVGF
jgi:release factor glutamine methyltransferase